MKLRQALIVLFDLLVIFGLPFLVGVGLLLHGHGNLFLFRRLGVCLAVGVFEVPHDGFVAHAIPAESEAELFSLSQTRCVHPTECLPVTDLKFPDNFRSP